MGNCFSYLICCLHPQCRSIGTRLVGLSWKEILGRVANKWRRLFEHLCFYISQAALQPDPLPVTTKSNLITVTGPANRRNLTKKILDFCGMLPIYNVEAIDIQRNLTAGEWRSPLNHSLTPPQTNTQQPLGVARFKTCNGLMNTGGMSTSRSTLN